MLRFVAVPLVLCSSFPPSSSSSSLSQQDCGRLRLGPQPGHAGFPTNPSALLPRGPQPLQSSHEGPVPPRQASFPSDGGWRPACSPLLILDGNSSPGEDSPAGRVHSPHWPASTPVCGSPGSPAGGCEAPECECGFPGGHQVLQHIQRLDGGLVDQPLPRI